MHKLLVHVTSPLALMSDCCTRLQAPSFFAGESVKRFELHLPYAGTDDTVQHYMQTVTEHIA